MITHQILLQPKATTTAAEIHAALDILDSLEEALDETFDVQLLQNASTGHQEYPYNLMMHYAESSQTTLLAHPLYQQVHTYLQDYCQHIVLFDAHIGGMLLLHRRKKHLKEKFSQEEWREKPLEERLKVLLREQLGVRERDLTPDASLVEDLDANSLDLVEIIMGIEEEFQVEVTDEDAEKLTTIQEILTFLVEKKVT